MPDILIVYFSRHGSVAAMAEQIAAGVDSTGDCQALLRTVPEVSANSEQSEPPIPSQGPVFASNDDLKNCDGLILGSPSYFGNMAAPLKYFLDQSSPLWLSGAMIGKPAGVFTSASSLHGGLESVLTSMMVPLLHHGMIISGLPYSESALHGQLSAGAPYGATHVATPDSNGLTTDEVDACRALGKRVATLALKLA